MKHNVNTVGGLQALLMTAVNDLDGLQSRDLHTIRAVISAVNSGSALLRVESSQNRNKPAKRAAK
jgi:hypothetical protein